MHHYGGNVFVQFKAVNVGWHFNKTFSRDRRLKVCDEDARQARSHVLIVSGMALLIVERAGPVELWKPSEPDPLQRSPIYTVDSPGGGGGGQGIVVPASPAHLRGRRRRSKTPAPVPRLERFIRHPIGD